MSAFNTDIFLRIHVKLCELTVILTKNGCILHIQGDTPFIFNRYQRNLLDYYFWSWQCFPLVLQSNSNFDSSTSRVRNTNRFIVNSHKNARSVKTNLVSFRSTLLYSLITNQEDFNRSNFWFQKDLSEVTLKTYV